MRIEVKELKKDICFQNQKISILKDVNMSFESGQIVTIVGESGSGKSTLLNIMSLLDDCTSGEYRWDDKDIFSLKKSEKQEFLAKYVGVVFQQYNLINNMTCYENVKVPLYLNRNVKCSERQGIVENMLESVGLSHRKDHFPKTLSGGEQQRAAIARALVNDPKVIFADEPTGNVDSENEKQILNLFREISDRGKIVVIVTHSEVVKGFSDKVYRISDGVIRMETA